ncbi:MAG TPA: hypothetical protein VG226_04960 [Acidimicrobiales bacterium]|nr:hypothetical protein [Acidimicrobiales bacterium]
MHEALLVISTFLASSVEMVEALTIVLAVGLTRGWRSALLGSAAALVVLAAVVAVLGPAVGHVPLAPLRLFVGALLLIFGLQWLRKAILRAGGLKALHDEDAIYRTQVERARNTTASGREMDWYSFTVAFKGVFLEGFEVVFIVVTFGASAHQLGPAAAGAFAAVIIVGIVGVVLRAPLARVPENTMKFVVGIMLTSFGTFWGAEGAGVRWPGSDSAILGVVALVALSSIGLVLVLRRRLALSGAR